MADKNVKYENVTIVDVTNVFAVNQIDLHLSQKVKKLNPETGEETENDVISIKLKSLQNMLAGQTPLVGRLARRSMGKRINPEIFGIILVGATCNVIGTFFKKGEQRENSEETYTCDGYKYSLENVALHLDEYAAQDYDELRQTKPYLEETKASNTQVANWILDAMKN